LRELILENLSDYSGAFLSKLKLGDFSNDKLAELLQLYLKLLMTLDSLWYFTVKERLDDKEALACDTQI